MLRLLRGRSRFLALDVVGQTLLPLLAAGALAAAGSDALLHRTRLPWDAGALTLMALASRGLAPSRASGRRFAVLYGLLFVGLLLPVRLWALCTLFRNRWGTRTVPDQRRVLVSNSWTWRPGATITEGRGRVA
jgi:hypothetical protein